MPELTREQLLAAKGKDPVRVDLPLGQGHIFVRAMSGRDREQFEEACSRLYEGGNAYCNRALLTVFCVCNAAGDRLFTGDDLDTLSALDANILNIIYDAAVDLNALGAKTGAAEKNS